MSSGYQLSPQAEVDHLKLMDSAIFAVKSYAKTSEQAWNDYCDGFAKLLRDARQEVDDDRMIQTKCADCNAIHTMRATVSHYQCVCSPRKDRFPFNERFVIEAEEK